MVIVDTSVWIEFFKGHEPFYTQVTQLIESRFARALQPIFGELYQGVLSGSEKQFIDEYWRAVFKLEPEDLMLHAGKFSYEHKLVSKGIKLIDASIIYSAYNYQCKIWTLDKKINSFLKSDYTYHP